jgi:hypothetical protein
MKTLVTPLALLVFVTASNSSCIGEQQIVPTREDRQKMDKFSQELFGNSWSIGPFEVESCLVDGSLKSAFADCRGENYFFANQNCVYTPGMWDSFSFSPEMKNSNWYLHVTFAGHTLRQSIDYIDEHVGSTYQFAMTDMAALLSFFRAFPERIVPRTRHGWMFCAGDEQSRKNNRIPCIENQNGVAILRTLSLDTVPKVGPVLENDTVALPNLQDKPIMFLTRRIERNTAVR